MCDFSERNSENERSVCSALGVDYSRCLSRLEKVLFVSNREFLLKYTDDITVLNYSDGLARNQKDLAALIAYGAKVIVLCNSEFFIPLFKCGITYYCVGSVQSFRSSAMFLVSTNLISCCHGLMNCLSSVSKYLKCSPAFRIGSESSSKCRCFIVFYNVGLLSGYHSSKSRGYMVIISIYAVYGK